LAVLAGQRAAEVDARRDRGQFSRVGYVERAQLLSGKGRDRDADLLDILLSPLSGNDDVTGQGRAARISLGLGRLVLRRSGRGRVLRQCRAGESAHRNCTKQD